MASTETEVAAINAAFVERYRLMSATERAAWFKRLGEHGQACAREVARIVEETAPEVAFELRGFWWRVSPGCGSAARGRW